MQVLRALLLLAFVAISNIAQAGTLYTFDLTFDGTQLTINPGSNTPAGTSLNPGDSYELTLQAALNDFWTVDGPYNNVFVPLSFSTLAGATRTANVDSVFYRNGAQVNQIIESNIEQSFVHIGANVWSLPVGLAFDKIVLNYTLVDSTLNGSLVDTTISNNSSVFFGFGIPDSPFFNSPNVSYHSSVSSVPEPGTFAIFGLGAVGLLIRRRAKK